MKLTTNQWALLDQVNLCRISIRNQLQTQKIQKSKLLECMCQLEPYLYDSNLHIHGIKQFEEENVLNIAKIMKAQYTQQTPKKYKINSNEYDIFKKKMDQENQKKKIQKSQTFPLLKNLKIQNNDQKEKQQIENKQLFDKRSKQQEKKNQISNNQNLEKIPQFIAASTLAKNTSVRKKFVPPFKKPEVQKEIIEEKKYQDPRLKNLDPKLIASIESEILDNNAPIKWSDIAGLGFAKKTIHQMIVWPMLRPDIFKGIRAPPKSILLFGPPGTGKTLIGKAIASQSNSTFFNISASSLTSKWVGQGEKMVKTLFLVAQVKQPSVIFIDEIDSLLCARSQNQQQSSRRIKTQFLVQLDGAKSNTDQRILIIGATNRPQELDDAVRRRFIKRLYIPLPNYEGRVQLFTTLSKQNTFDLNEKDINQISLLTKGFSGADLTSLSSQSALIPIRRLSSKIQNIEGTQVPATTLNDLKEGLKLVRPSVNMNQLKGYQQWNAEFGSYQFNNDSINLDT